MKKKLAGFAALAALLLISAGVHYAQLPADNAVTRPDHMQIGDLGTCNEGETWYNLVNHFAKRCTSANTGAFVVAVPSVAANQVYMLSASTLPTAATVGDLNLTSNTAVGNTAQRVCHVTYSFAVDGGATPIVPAGNCTIPINAVITNAGIQATTAVTAVGSATVAVGCTGGTACGVAAIMAATAKASLGTAAFGQSAPVPQTASTFVKTTAATTLSLTIATGPLTAGIIEIYVFYYVSSS